MSERSVTGKKVKREFQYTGLVLIAYAIAVLFLPHMLLLYAREALPEVLENEILVLGIWYLFLVIGTLVPFFLLRKRSLIKTKHLMVI